MLAATGSGVGNQAPDEIIVSLTSFDKRLNDVYLTVESLMRQTLKPDRILLNISAETLANRPLPQTLARQQQRGLEIVPVERDLGPYTKYHYTLQANPNALIVTVDDDILYPLDMIEQLYSAYQRQPQVIHCHRAHRILCNNNGELLPYKQWDFGTTSSDASLSIFPTGVGGVLYFPGCFAPEIFDQDTFMKLAPGADDVWLKAMSLKQGVQCARIEDDRQWQHRFTAIPGSQKTSLKRGNKQKVGGNDVKIAKVFEHFNLLPKLNGRG